MKQLKIINYLKSYVQVVSLIDLFSVLLRILMKFTQKLTTLMQIEKKRLQNKGWGNFLAGLFMLITIVTGTYYFGKPIWIENVPENLEDKKTFFVLGSLAVHVLTQLFILGCYSPGYFGAKIYKKFECNPHLKWPWEKENGREEMKKITIRYIINHVVTYPIIMYTLASTGIRVRFHDFPSFTQFFGQIVILYYIEDFFFYVFHRATHDSQYLYKNVHKHHHQFQKIFLMIRDDFHPVDYLSGVLSFSMGLMMLGSRVHCFTYYFWFFWKINIGTENHSGYEFPWSPFRILPFICGASFHDHHHSVNSGNYALSSFIWDVMFQTGDSYLDEFLERKPKSTQNKLENTPAENTSKVKAN